MTTLERFEQLQSQLRDATASREQLTEQLQQTHIAIHQLQGACAVLQAIMKDEVGDADQPPDDAKPLHAVKTTS